MAAIPARLDALIFSFFNQSIDYNKPADSGRGRLRFIVIEAVRVIEF
jgi:hypothetical protein